MYGGGDCDGGGGGGGGGGIFLSLGVQDGSATPQGPRGQDSGGTHTPEYK